MNASSDANHVVFAARPLARLLTRDREFMNTYKEAAREDRIRAISSGGRNYVLVADEAVAETIRKLDPKLQTFRYDEANQRVEPASPHDS